MTSERASTLRWTLRPRQTPTVRWHCHACEQMRDFTCAEKFRLNAQQANVDVWLLYRCMVCDNTLNIEIHARCHARSFNQDYYKRLMHNDSDLAWQYAFNFPLLESRSVRINKTVPFDVIGDSLHGKHIVDSLLIEVVPEFPLEIRIDRFIAEETGLSRSTVERLMSSGDISMGMKRIRKRKMVVQDPFVLSLSRTVFEEIRMSAGATLTRDRRQGQNDQ